MSYADTWCVIFVSATNEVTHFFSYLGRYKKHEVTVITCFTRYATATRESELVYSEAQYYDFYMSHNVKLLN